MTAATHSLERRAMSLGTANAIDYALQFLLPVVLTRALDAHSFGEYRLLWLAVGTALLTPLFMPESLYYFVPRSTREAKRLYVNQTLLWVFCGGLAVALALSPWDPLLPASLRELVARHSIALPLFAFLWVASYLLDVLPTVDERVGWQARVIVSLAALRAVSLSAVAIATRELGPVLWTLVAFAAVRLGLLLTYIAREHGLGGPFFRRETFAGQVRHAAPFGMSGVLYGLRTQADQWVAAALFPAAQFASFSIALVLAPMVQLFRQSVNHVFLPSMSRLHSGGDFKAMLALNSRANAMVALLVYPLLAFAFVFAEQLVTVVYTAAYLGAVPVMRLYTLALIVFVVELNSILLLLRQGAFSAKVNAGALLVAVPLSYVGALQWGLVGAALGSVVVVFAERALSLSRIAELTATPVAKLQDWASLGGILAAAAIAAAAAGAALRGLEMRPFAALAAGAAIVALAYPAALLLTGQRRSLVDFFSSLRHAGAHPAVAD
jgi:O-antigen/teichoic acid export membrane protein